MPADKPKHLQSSKCPPLHWLIDFDPTTETEMWHNTFGDADLTHRLSKRLLNSLRMQQELEKLPIENWLELGLEIVKENWLELLYMLMRHC